MLASRRNGTLYTGVTDNLRKRIWQHKNNVAESFTKKYNVHNLVYFEQADNAVSAIEREKRLKKWNRSWKIKLIEKENPKWIDLYEDLFGQEEMKEKLVLAKAGNGFPPARE